MSSKSPREMIPSFHVFFGSRFENWETQFSQRVWCGLAGAVQGAFVRLSNRLTVDTPRKRKPNCLITGAPLRRGCQPDMDNLLLGGKVDTSPDDSFLRCKYRIFSILQHPSGSFDLLADSDN